MKRAFTLIEMVVVVAIVLVLVVILWPVFQRPNPGTRKRERCRGNLKQIGLALIQYTQDYDDKFPRVSHKGSRGWSQDLQPYIKGWPLFQCPSTSNHVLKTTDYFYNSRFQGLKIEDLVSQTQTIMGGDGPDDAPMSSHLSGLPVGATTNENSFARRHLDMANYLFADGHVRALKPEKIVPNLSMTSSEPTFAVR
jgi:prepilin-type N-terminal cleavage/methylation domain-containing protein/prepilin-type processing-associated H-X9-DG protein